MISRTLALFMRLLHLNPKTLGRSNVPSPGSTTKTRVYNTQTKEFEDYDA